LVVYCKEHGSRGGSKRKRKRRKLKEGEEESTLELGTISKFGAIMVAFADTTTAFASGADGAEMRDAVANSPTSRRIIAIISATTTRSSGFGVETMFGATNSDRRFALFPRIDKTISTRIGRSDGI